MGQYLERIETSIGRAGKNSTYTKLFRFDKKMLVAVWKKLLSDFFRGNPLIPEYLGAQDDGINEALAVDSHPVLNERVRPNLAAFIGLDTGAIPAGIQVDRQDSTLPDGQYIASLETGCESVHGFFGNLVDLSNVVAMGAIDGTLNLPRISFGEASDLQLTMQKTTAGLAEALNGDYEKGCVLNASAPLTWQHGELIVTLTIAGAADLVARTLIRLLSVVDTSKSPSQWIQALSDLIRELAPISMEHQKWSIIQSGMLRLRRSEEVSFRLILPEEIMQSLTASGDLPKELQP